MGQPEINYKWWSELGHGGLLPVFINGGQSPDMGVYCLSFQMLVRARTWGSTACLFKCWSELGHGGLLPVFTNGGQSPDMGVYCLSLQMVVRARTWGSIVLSV